MLKLPNFTQKSIVTLWHSFLALLYPPVCLHCKEVCDPTTILCPSCTQKLELIPTHGRCNRCFCLQETCTRCIFCKEIKPRWDLAASSFEYAGPVQSLIHHFKNGSGFLAKTFASFLYLQHTIQEWPLPDLIVPVPQSMMKGFERGYDPTALLAAELSTLMKRPWQKVLRRKSGGIPQAHRTIHERLTLPKELFFIKKNALIENKILLLIDDIYASGTTLNRCAELLASSYAREVYVLTIATCEYTKIVLCDK